ncbi:hypothetical protein Z517_11845 [Fonsecaea pedrosoi CBS 271.37]|uniref:Uncharacterized protein n=1 Tax=Fonsecaea pedrosoi CBS 271.37 TaxID=1442368 RepID=A0A0D2GRL8_9EURO|nr:uncharacterized protein Z517_11845 [Fonsecaea pedrosoi CBS 271.37]KIW75074.1 hypothetical protein Z517_11845 [Fonsecaea pedrosoi CBS 271.37]
MSAVQAWTLGDKYYIPKFQNALSDELRSFWAGDLVHPRTFLWLVENSADVTALRQLVCDYLSYGLVHSSSMYRYACDEDEVESPSADGYARALKDLLANPEIGLELFWATKNLKRGGTDPKDSGRCYYHVQVEGQTCVR